jgi:hypothetical protein
MTAAVQVIIGLVVFGLLMLPFLVIRARGQRRRRDLLADLERDAAQRRPSLAVDPERARASIAAREADYAKREAETLNAFRPAPRRGPDGRFLPKGTP